MITVEIMHGLCPAVDIGAGDGLSEAAKLDRFPLNSCRGRSSRASCLSLDTLAI
jgi:hypothetical protein